MGYKHTADVTKIGITNEVKLAVNASFTRAILHDYDYDGHTLTVRLVDPKVQGAIYETYLTTGDKINKLLACEPVRLFCKIIELRKIEIALATDEKIYALVIHKPEVEQFYSIDIDALRNMNENEVHYMGEKWIQEFIDKIDTKERRQQFIDGYVVSTDKVMSDRQ